MPFSAIVRCSVGGTRHAETMRFLACLFDGQVQQREMNYLQECCLKVLFVHRITSVEIEDTETHTESLRYLSLKFPYKNI